MAVLLNLASLLISVYFSATHVHSDPCTTYEPLPRAAYRGGQCAYDRDKPVCDNILPSDTWFRAEGLTGDLEIQTTAPGFQQCGTRFPIWMNGSHPAEVDGAVEREACQEDVVSNCSQIINIRVQNCSAFYVYQLPATSACPEAYCFGENDECPPPDPCDIFEHESIDYDGSRSTSCRVSDDSQCDNLGSGTWNKFTDKFITGTPRGYLEIASSCPTDTSCGTEGPLWISGTVMDYPNGTRVSSVCVKFDEDCCAVSAFVYSKQCPGTSSGANNFTVYFFDQPTMGLCGRFCTDDASPVCPATPPPTTTTVAMTTVPSGSSATSPTPALTTTMGPISTTVTQGSSTSDTAGVPQATEAERTYLWVIGAVAIAAIVGALVGGFITYRILSQKKKRVGDSALFNCGGGDGAGVVKTSVSNPMAAVVPSSMAPLSHSDMNLYERPTPVPKQADHTYDTLHDDYQIPQI